MLLDVILVLSCLHPFHNPFFSICPSPELLTVLGPLERYMTPTLDAALLISSTAGADLGRTSDRLESDAS